MPAIRLYDERSMNNRARVRKYRNFRKLKSIHEQKISEKLNSYEFQDKIVGDGHDSNNVDKEFVVKDKLKYWSVHHRISKTALSDLLSILRYAGLVFLPKDGRTLMGTPIKVPIVQLSNGKLWYHGIRKCLENLLIGCDRDIAITLDFNFDGLPISKSSNKQFWPILTSVRGKNIFRSGNSNQ